MPTLHGTRQSEEQDASPIFHSIPAGYSAFPDARNQTKCLPLTVTEVWPGTMTKSKDKPRPPFTMPGIDLADETPR